MDLSDQCCGKVILLIPHTVKMILLNNVYNVVVLFADFMR